MNTTALSDNELTSKRSGILWVVLCVSVVMWVVLSIWAYRTFVSDDAPSGASAADVVQIAQESQKSDTMSSQPSDEGALIAVNEVAARIAAEEQAAEEARLAEEARVAEEVRLAEEARLAAEEERAAEEEAAEEARVAEEVRLAEEARLAEEEKAVEAALIAAEEEAAEEARVAEEVRLAEEARLAEEERAAEAARIAAEEKAAEEARVAEEVRLAEEARLAEEERAAEAARIAAEEQANNAQTERVLRRYERLRDEELSVLAGLSARLRFQNRSEVVTGDVEASLDRLFEPLFLYPEMSVRIFVTTNEFRSVGDDYRLSQERGRAIFRYLVDRGLQPSRFSLEIVDGEGLPYGSHRVRLSVEEKEQ